MEHALYIFLSALLLAPLPAFHAADAPMPEDVLAFIDRHCIDCHDDSLAKGDFDITALAFDLSHADTLGRWTRVFDRVEKGDMPPLEKSKVNAGERKAAVSQLGEALLAAARQTVPEVIGDKHRDGNWWLVWEPGFEHWFKARWRHEAWDLGWQNLLGTPTHALPLPGRPEPPAARGEE
jgi:hypothetical protein